MTAKTAYSLAEVTQLKTHEIGQWAALLGQLRQQHVPITDGFVIPIAVFQRLPSTKSLLISREVELPSDIAQSWLKAYYQRIGDQPAFISISWRHTLQNDRVREHVKGDANVMEAILELWAEVQNQAEAVGSIVVQAQPKPQAYGVVQTNVRNPHQKAVVVVRASHTPLAKRDAQDEYKVDVRSWQITDTRIARAGKTVLDDQQILIAAQAGYRAKLLHLEDGRLDWSIAHHHLTPVRYQGEIDSPAVSEVIQPGPALLAGNGVIPGVIKGRCVIYTTKLTKIPPNTILVAPALTELPLDQMKHIIGVIIETTPSQAVSTQLWVYHIPTLIQAKGATRRLKTGQVVILDSAHHQVFGPQLATRTRPRTTQIILETAQSLSPDLVELQADGVMFKPEPALLESETHPVHTLRSFQRRTLQKKLLSELQSFRAQPLLLYRLADLSAADIAGLRYGSQFEVPERNPDLGYTGALRALSQTEILDFELAMLAELHRTVNTTINVVVPGVRSPGEFQAIQQHLHLELGQPRWLKTWLELSTPENLLNYRAYSHLSHHGIVINLPQIQQLLVGADTHNQDIFRRYDWNFSLLHRLLQPVTAELHGLPWYAVCPPDSPDCIRLCLELGVAGFIVKTYHASKTQDYLMRFA